MIIFVIFFGQRADKVIILAFFLFVKFKLMMWITLFNVHADDVFLIFGQSVRIIVLEEGDRSKLMKYILGKHKNANRLCPVNTN